MSNAKPMDPNMRALGYVGATGTCDRPRQRRRRRHKLGRLAALERRTGSSSGLIKSKPAAEAGR